MSGTAILNVVLSLGVIVMVVTPLLWAIRTQHRDPVQPAFGTATGFVAATQDRRQATRDRRRATQVGFTPDRRRGPRDRRSAVRPGYAPLASGA